MIGSGGIQTGGSYDPAFGGIPTLPSPIASQGAAVSGDLGNLSSILQLLSNLDTAQQQQLLGQYNTAIPNYSELTSTASSNIGQELHGGVPQDVISQLTQQAAERGISTGMPGSSNSNAAYLRALGLTSLGQQQTGMQNLATMTQTAPVAPLYNPASLLVTPEQQQQEASAQSLYNAAPVPAAAAQKAMQTASAVGGSALPWWAQGSGMPTTLAPGSYKSGNTWHSPVMA
jgi:hypothetical protein